MNKWFHTAHLSYIVSPLRRTFIALSAMVESVTVLSETIAIVVDTGDSFIQTYGRDKNHSEL